MTSAGEWHGPVAMPASASASHASWPLDAGADHVVDVREPLGRARETGIVGPFGAADHAGKSDEVMSRAALDHEEAVRRAERVVDELRVAGIGEPEGPVVDAGVGHRDHRVVHRDVDVLALAGAVAVPQRREDADGREQCGACVAEGAHRRRDRRHLGVALEVVEARHGLGDRRIRRPVGVGRGHEVPEARHRHVDHRRVDRGHVVVAEAESGHRAGAEVLGDDVEAGDEPPEDVLTLGRLEIEGEAALVEVVAQEGRADEAALRIAHARERGAARVAALGVLHLHHLGAEPRHQLRGERQRLLLLERQDPHAVERLAVPRQLGVDDVTDLHAAQGTWEGIDRVWLGRQPSSGT